MTHRATTITRALVGASAAALLVVGLSGCSLLPTLPGGNGGSGGDGGDGGSGGSGDDTSTSELVGTTWSGTDSDGDSWGLELQEDGTVGLTYNGNSWDDAGDVWSQTGSTVNFHIGFDDGDIDMVGQYEGLDQPMETAGTYTGGSFTVTLERD